jgi:hypothetical protein
LLRHLLQTGYLLQRPCQLGLARKHQSNQRLRKCDPNPVMRTVAICNESSTQMLQIASPVCRVQAGLWRRAPALCLAGARLAVFIGRGVRSDASHRGQNEKYAAPEAQMWLPLIYIQAAGANLAHYLTV